MRLGNMQLGVIVGAGEGVMIIGHLIIVSAHAVAVAVMVMVVVVDGAVALHAGKQGTHIEQNMAHTDPERYHPPRRCSHRQLIPNIRAAAEAVRRTIRHTLPNNLALDNRIRRCRSRSCLRKYNHISIHDSRDSLD
jgi:hypothetical protein